MATLSKRAAGNAFLTGLLSVVEGQVRDAMNAHKEWNLSDAAARSIAKRVSGDVAANWSRLHALRTSVESQAREGGGNSVDHRG